MSCLDGFRVAPADAEPGCDAAELPLNASPALKTTLLDGWLLPFGDEYTPRANSVKPIYPRAAITGPNAAVTGGPTIGSRGACQRFRAVFRRASPPWWWAAAVAPLARRRRW